jgi:GH15 family glucan-1,4-alpha-glucosidase
VSLTDEPVRVSPARRDGHLPIRDYAVVGNGTTAALVGSDGSVDWLCLPDLDSPSVFGALLDARAGGRFALAPAEPFRVERRYVPDTNVLEMTFVTDGGAIRLTDAMPLPREGLAPQRELLRSVAGLSGTVRVRWRVEPRFGYAGRRTRISARSGLPVASAGSDALGVRTWGAGEPRCEGDAIAGEFELPAGSRALLALSAAHGEPLVFPGRAEADARLHATVRWWKGWSASRTYSGPWREAVIRSALALKLLVFAPSGAIAAAATTSLPETPGGERNWDYRFSWVRDAVFTLDAFLALGCPAEARAYFWWLLHASQLTHPRLRVLYRLGGGTRSAERELELAGYGGARPVRVGNAAAPQRQLDVYGELMQTARRYVQHVGRLDAETGRRLAQIADEVCELWQQPDAGIWEVRAAPAPITESKVMCRIALDCAARMAADRHLPARHAERWRASAAAIDAFVEQRCWSERRRSYTRAAGSDELDASLLLPVAAGYRPLDARRLDLTVDAVRRELSAGPLLYRYRGEDGLAGREGAFVACSFWLVEALARRGRVEQAAALMEELLPLANDVGLYAEEIDPGSGAFLGNFPQGLVHLALVNAAVACAEASGR